MKTPTDHQRSYPFTVGSVVCLKGKTPGAWTMTVVERYVSGKRSRHMVVVMWRDAEGGSHRAHYPAHRLMAIQADLAAEGVRRR